MDIAICEMLGIEPVGVPTLKRAKLRGWWPDNISYPILSPGDIKYLSFQLPSTAGYLLTHKKRPKRSPVPKKNCNGCGECKEICPKGAVEIMSERANINYRQCIQCYCCHEICPEIFLLKEQNTKYYNQLQPNL
jgi:ferredoxin